MTEPRKIIQISSFGVENTASTQCNWITTALCNDGSVWMQRDHGTEWIPLPDIPQPEPEPTPRELGVVTFGGEA